MIIKYLIHSSIISLFRQLVWIMSPSCSLKGVHPHGFSELSRFFFYYFMPSAKIHISVYVIFRYPSICILLVFPLNYSFTLCIRLWKISTTAIIITSVTPKMLCIMRSPNPDNIQTLLWQRWAMFLHLGLMFFGSLQYIIKSSHVSEHKMSKSSCYTG